MIKVKATLNIDEEQLKKAFELDNYSLERAFAIETGWLVESGITFESMEVINDEDGEEIKFIDVNDDTLELPCDLCEHNETKEKCSNCPFDEVL